MKDCHMFFFCYNPEADIEVVDKHLKELSVKFDNNKPTEDDGSKTCVVGGNADSTRVCKLNYGLNEEIS